MQLRNSARTRDAAKKKINFMVFVLPAILIFSLFYFVPLLGSVLYSLTNWNGSSVNFDFIGLANYQRAFADVNFLNSLKVTAIIGGFYVVLVNGISFALALLLDSQHVKQRNVLRGLVFVPNTVSLIVVAFIWTFMFSHVYNPMVKNLGLPFLSVYWFSRADTAIMAVVIAHLWQSIGYYMMIYLAGLQTIDQSILEAADIDGAGYFRRLWKVVIPMMMPALTVNFFLTIANSFKKFEIVFQMTAGGPGMATRTIALDVYKEAYDASNMGLASAKAVIMCLIIVILTSVQLRYFKKREIEA